MSKLVVVCLFHSGVGCGISLCGYVVYRRYAVKIGESVKITNRPTVGQRTLK